MRFFKRMGNKWLGFVTDFKILTLDIHSYPFLLIFFLVLSHVRGANPHYISDVVKRKFRFHPMHRLIGYS